MWLRSGEPLAETEVHRGMSIEKDSTGLPEVNVRRRTTKVNLSLVLGVLIFFAVMAGLVAYLWNTHR